MNPGDLLGVPSGPPGAPRRLKRESSAEQAAAHIRRLIMSGEVTTGERLKPDEIAEELGVSRIPIREALIALDREGLVRFELNRGAYVTGLGADDIRDHYELRGLVFGLIARRAVETAGPDDLASMTDVAAAMRTAADLDTFAAHNERFIGRLFKIAASPRLTAALLVTPPILHHGFFDFVPEGRTIQEDGAARFVDALAASDPDAADAALVTMLRRQGAAVLAAFTAAGLVAPD